MSSTRKNEIYKNCLLHWDNIRILLMAVHNKEIDVKDPGDNTLLILSSYDRSGFTMELLLRKPKLWGVNNKNCLGTTLFWCVRENNVTGVKTLLRHGVDIGMDDSFPDTFSRSIVLWHQRKLWSDFFAVL